MLSRTAFSIKTTNKITALFDELKITKFLYMSNISKAKGISSTSAFQLVFFLAFQNKNWFELLESKFKESLPSKDVIYRFLDTSTYNWRKFLSLLASHTISLIEPLTKDERVKCFIIDDTPYNRGRSKRVELISKIYDHVSHSYINGFHQLTLGWSDGASFIPLDFAMVATVTRILKQMNMNIDKRTSGYKRRIEALMPKTELVVKMVENALNKGISANYVLMDSWFTSGKMIHNITKLGVDVIGMIKHTPKVFYSFGERFYTLENLYFWSLKYKAYGKNKNIISSIIVKTKQDQDIKIVFVKNQNNNQKWLAIATSDLSLSDEEIIRIYGYRWDIEVFFKFAKSELKLDKEFQVRSFDSLLAHSTIVYARYILLAWERRQNLDPKTLGGLFRLCCEDISGVVYSEVINKLLLIIESIKGMVNKKVQSKIDELLLIWQNEIPGWLMNDLQLITFQQCKCQ